MIRWRQNSNAPLLLLPEPAELLPVLLGGLPDDLDRPFGSPEITADRAHVVDDDGQVPAQVRFDDAIIPAAQGLVALLGADDPSRRFREQTDDFRHDSYSPKFE